MNRLALLAWLAAAGGCAAPAKLPAGPYVVVLGTAQDGGLPQMGCRDELCSAARIDPERRRLVTSLLLADPRSGKRWLFDATPDLREQVERARPHPASRVETGARPALFDGVFLTHAHVGHCAGLLQFGREIYGARELPVWTTPRMGEFLASNAPWSLLVETGAIRIEQYGARHTSADSRGVSTVPGSTPTAAGGAARAAPPAAVGVEPGTVLTPPYVEVELASDLHVGIVPVPHRDEFSDTVAFVIRGPRASVGYLPDIDKWERWDVKLEDFLASVDVAFVDGTFFDDGEVPGRAMAEIPHPFIRETLARLSNVPAVLRARVVFTHLNHTNPAAVPGSEAERAVRAAGLRVAVEGEIVGL